jgi:predicted transcriptional regulator
VSIHHESRGKRHMGKASTARKLTYGEAVAEALAHDKALIASIDRSMADVAADRVITLDEFVERMRKKTAKAESAYETRFAE